MPTPFQINVVTPAAEVLDASVEYASIPAHDGQIGIAHLRAPLLVKLGYGKMTLKLPNNQGEQTYFVGGGFAQVKDDKLTVLTDEAVLADDLKTDEAEAALSDALALPTTPELQREQREKAVARGRAMAAMAHG